MGEIFNTPRHWRTLVVRTPGMRSAGRSTTTCDKKAPPARKAAGLFKDMLS